MQRYNDLIEGFNERLLQAINNRGVSIRYVAKTVGIGFTTLQKYTKGEYQPDILILTRLCTLLGVSETWLLTGKEEY